METKSLARDLLPEDAYDAGDSFLERLLVVERASKSIASDPNKVDREFRKRALLVTLDKLDDEVQAFMNRILAARVMARD